MKSKRVAIIGAGWSGLQIAAVLRDCGYDIHIFEQLDDVGGTWHPANAYAGLSIHTPAFRCQFHDFDNWRDRDRLARLPAHDVFDNCRAFAKAKGLLPSIALRTRVIGIDWDTTARVNRVTILDETAGSIRIEHFDYVVSTQFNSPRLPALQGQENFAGEILHSGAVKEEVLQRIERERPRIVLIGGSKSAADIALLFVKHEVPFTWLMRRMYWFLSFDKGYWDAARARPSRMLHRLLYFAGLGLANGPLTTRVVFRVWRAFGLMQCPGTEPGDATAFHHGWLDNQQIETLRTQTHQIYGDCERLDGRTLHTTDGRDIACDMLVCATGCNPIASPVKLSVNGVAMQYDDIEFVYRMSVIPALPHLIFTGYSMFGFGPLNGYHRAAWIMRFIEQNLTPDQLLEIARADGDSTYMFRRGSFLFDGSTNLLTTVKAMNRRMGEGVYEYGDVKRHYRDIAVKHIYAPLRGAEQFVRVRRRDER